MKWYVIQVLSGSEKRTKRIILERIAKSKLSHLFDEIVIPFVQFVEIRGINSIITEKLLMPGYVLIHMTMNSQSWHLVCDTLKTEKFLGTKNAPKPLTDSEIDNIFKRMKAQVITKTYDVGEKVLITDGLFKDLSGTIEKIDVDAQILRIAVSIFGKDTIVELSFDHVKRFS